MNNNIAEQLYKTLKDPATCKKCEHYRFAIGGAYNVPYCVLKWCFDKECPEDLKEGGQE